MAITLTNGQQVEDWRVFFRRRLALGSSWDIVQPLELVQLDDNLPVLAATLTVDGDPYTPAGASYSIRMRRPDGTAVQAAALGVDADGVVYVEFAPPLTSIAGTGYAAIEASRSDGSVKCTQLFRLHIAHNPIPGGD